MKYKLIDFKVHGNQDGKLVALEKNEVFPFEIKRVYYIWDTVHDAIRGKHAHKNLQQVIVCVRGQCDFILDDGVEKKNVHLSNPAQGLYITNNIWREFTNFSDDCVVMVLASEKYNPDDYIHNYSEFVESIKKLN